METFFKLMIGGFFGFIFGIMLMACIKIDKEEYDERENQKNK